MKSPCYDVETKTDCKDRCVGCSTICALWHKYTEERNKEYEKRAQNAIQNGADISAQFRLRKKLNNYKPRSKRR